MFDDVLARLVDEGVRFVVTGGRAVCFHGYERPIADLDIVVEREPAPATYTTQALMKLGFYPTLPLPLSTVVVLPFVDARGRRVDVNAIYRIPFPELIERAVTRTLLDRSIAVISLPDLIAVKRWRGRDYDVADLGRLSET